jgi:hypothetical protein
MKLTRDRSDEVENTSDDAIAEALRIQGVAIESLKSAIQDLTSLTVREISDDDSDDGLDLHIGIPTSKQFETISKMTAIESSPEDWVVVPFHASNSCIDYSLRRWHRNTAIQMGLTMVGRPILMDHDWSSAKNSAAGGFIFDAKVIIEPEAPEEVLRGGGYEEYNREIVAQEGYQWLYLCAAFSKTADAAEGIKSRKFNDCSTGSVLSKPYMICPDCSQEHGRDVSFFEKSSDAKGKSTFTCNHLVPSKWMLDMVAMYGEDGEEFNFAKYCILGGERNEGIELSLCNRGALPAASVIRQAVQ